MTDKGQTFHPTCVAETSEQGQFPGPNHTTAHSAVVSWVRVINPTLISEAKGAYVRPDIYSTSFNEGLALNDLYGIPNANVPGELALHTSGMGAMIPSGYARMGDPQWLPLLTRDNTFQVSGSVTKTAGAHNIKMGGGVILREFSVLQSNSAKGLWNFSANPTNSGSLGLGGGDGMASFLLGYPSDVRRRLTPLLPYYHTNEPSVYVQDDWRARSWLTVNMGLRYDVYTPFTEEDDQLANFVPEQGKILVASVDGVSRTAGVATDYSNIQPRLGFSASLPHRIVVRGGYGMSFFPNNKNSNAYLKNPPFDFTYGPVTSAADSNGLPTQFLKNGLPAVSPISPNDPRGAVIGTGIDFQSDRAQQFNVMVEKEFASNVATIGYVGSRGDRLQTNPNFNLAPVTSVGGSPDPRRPYASVYPGMSNANSLHNDGELKYNAMQLLFQRRFTAGLSFNTHYTFAACSPADIGAVGYEDPRVGPRRARRPSPLRAAGELRPSVGQFADRPLARAPVRLAAQRRGVLADGVGLLHHQRRAADEYRFRWQLRSTECHRRSEPAGKRADAGSLVQHRRIRGAAGGHAWHERQRTARSESPARPVAAPG